MPGAHPQRRKQSYLLDPRFQLKWTGYLVVVVLGGLLLGHTSTPHVGLSVLATAVVAVGFDRVLTRLEAFANRVVHRGRPSPYDAMRRFAGAVDSAGPAEDLPVRMARLLAEGTGAEWAQVWVALDGQPVPAATWPPEAEARLIASPHDTLPYSAAVEFEALVAQRAERRPLGQVVSPAPDEGGARA